MFKVAIFTGLNLFGHYLLSIIGGRKEQRRAPTVASRHEHPAALVHGEDSEWILTIHPDLAGFPSRNGGL
jgi:hypothetical protein